MNNITHSRKRAIICYYHLDSHKTMDDSYNDNVLRESKKDSAHFWFEYNYNTVEGNDITTF